MYPSSALRMFCLSIALTFFIIFTSNPALADNKAMLERLEKIIQQQQKQIEAQSKAIESLQKQVNELQGETVETREKPMEKKPFEWVSPGSNKAKVKLYGQVNRGVLYVDDGDDETLYQVDNDNSSTRIGILGSIQGSETVDVGTKIEVQFESNSSSEVNQSNKRGVGSNSFTKRHLDLYVNSKNLGKLSVGFGSTASDTTCERDLSGTGVAGYSAIVDMAGGQFFYNNTTGVYSSSTIGSAFTNMDGLSRDDRIRYDTPSFKGLSASTSYIADGGGDVALRYLNKLGSVKVDAAASYANPGSKDSKNEYQMTGSLSALHDSGFNITFAGGSREHKSDADDDGLFAYSKVGYQDNFFSFGKTALAIDYGYYEDIEMNGDEASTIGAQFVQTFQEWNTEYYIGYRLYMLDRDGADLDDINAVLSGLRVSF